LLLAPVALTLGRGLPSFAYLRGRRVEVREVVDLPAVVNRMPEPGLFECIQCTLEGALIPAEVL
jgi:hypothetical protein